MVCNILAAMQEKKVYCKETFCCNKLKIFAMISCCNKKHCCNKILGNRLFFVAITFCCDKILLQQKHFIAHYCNKDEKKGYCDGKFMCNNVLLQQNIFVIIRIYLLQQNCVAIIYHNDFFSCHKLLQ